MTPTRIEYRACEARITNSATRISNTPALSPFRNSKHRGNRRGQYSGSKSRLHNSNTRCQSFRRYQPSFVLASGALSPIKKLFITATPVTTVGPLLGVPMGVSADTSGQARAVREGSLLLLRESKTALLMLRTLNSTIGRSGCNGSITGTDNALVDLSIWQVSRTDCRPQFLRFSQQLSSERKTV